ncbi:hypothetical protein EDB85DRAFT_1929688 [Lactarius pseudohatsudake]|nr:hypothetical protein EDB85DRAFT_1929688 [Lactarius pseudohatsudake]
MPTRTFLTHILSPERTVGDWSYGDQILEYFISHSNQIPPILINPTVTIAQALAPTRLLTAFSQPRPPRLAIDLYAFPSLSPSASYTHTHTHSLSLSLSLYPLARSPLIAMDRRRQPLHKTLPSPAARSRASCRLCPQDPVFVVSPISPIPFKDIKTTVHPL